MGTMNVGAMSRSGFTLQHQAGVQPFAHGVAEPILPQRDLPTGPLCMVLILLLFSPRGESGSCLYSCQAGTF